MMDIRLLRRTTVECVVLIIEIVRKLCKAGIYIYFEKENINTLDAKGEVLMTIMAALAQQESESLSANVRLGVQRICRVHRRGQLSADQART